MFYDQKTQILDRNRPLRRFSASDGGARQIHVRTLGSDRKSVFYRGANFFENVKFDEKTCFSTEKLKFMIGIGLFYVFRHPRAEPDKTMCVTLSSLLEN